MAQQLPPYSVRVSARARHVRLTVTPRDGLVVVVPKGWRGDAGKLVAERLDWVTHALSRVAEKRALFTAGAEGLLPDRVELRAFGEELPVEYHASGAPGSGAVRAREAEGMLVLAGDIDDADACLRALVRWLGRVSRERLLPMLAELSAEVGLPYASARVRHQKTRWGSCSARKTISLNRNLVFLPAHLARSVMLHELAHTHVLDHSPKFWAELRKFDADALSNRRELRHAEDFVPPWAAENLQNRAR
ncbi:MAG: M48 family metallopeptidase [Coriobacteriia bacterium]